MKKELKFPETKKLKNNFKKGSNVLLKCFLPELELDWDGLYFFVKDRKDNLINIIKKSDKTDNVG